MLMEGRIDLIAATMTKNPERAKQIDFSYTYFLTGQKFLTKKGTVKSLKDLEGKKIGTAKGSTSEQNVAKAVPSATVLSFDDYPQGVLAVQQGKAIAVTTDESILAGQLGKLEKNPATKGQFEIPDLAISEEPYGIGMRKGDTNFVKFVNDTILEMEKNGEAAKIFEKWFGPNSDSPIQRGSFKITADILAWPSGVGISDLAPKAASRFHLSLSLIGIHHVPVAKTQRLSRQPHTRP